MRALAALAIIVVHVQLVTGTYGEDMLHRLVIRFDACVAIFFALSAFLLYRPMIAHRTGGPQGPGVSDYARRRFFRIYPTYWVALTCLAVVPGLAGVFSGDWWYFYTLLQNWDPGRLDATCLTRPGLLCGLPQTWTLTTEVSFYVLLPLYAWVAARLVARRPGTRIPTRELVMLAGLGALSLSAYLASPSLAEEPWFRYSLLGHFDWLALGLAFAAVSVAIDPGGRPLPGPVRWLAERPGVCWGAALAVFLAMAFLLPPLPFPFESRPGFYLAMHLGHTVLAALLLFPVIFGDPNRGLIRRGLGHPVAVWVGLISYGLYLWHFSIAYHLGVGGAELSFVPVLALTLALAIPLAAFNWYVVEKPLMRLKYGRGWKGARERWRARGGRDEARAA